MKKINTTKANRATNKGNQGNSSKYPNQLVNTIIRPHVSKRGISANRKENTLSNELVGLAAQSNNNTPRASDIDFIAKQLFEIFRAQVCATTHLHGAISNSLGEN